MQSGFPPLDLALMGNNAIPDRDNLAIVWSDPARPARQYDGFLVDQDRIEVAVAGEYQVTLRMIVGSEALPFGSVALHIERLRYIPLLVYETYLWATPQQFLLRTAGVLLPGTPLTIRCFNDSGVALRYSLWLTIAALQSDGATL